MNYFKDIHNYKAAILRHDHTIGGRQFPAGSVMVIDDYYSSFGAASDIYICVRMPRNYSGNRPMLSVWSYNEHTKFWECDLYRNKITEIMWKFWAKSGRPKIRRDFLSDDEATEMMKTYSRKKAGVGSRDRKNVINNPVAYNQVTEYAYWANLDNARSGNASVVAANIRY